MEPVFVSSFFTYNFLYNIISSPRDPSGERRRGKTRCWKISVGTNASRPFSRSLTARSVEKRADHRFILSIVQFFCYLIISFFFLIPRSTLLWNRHLARLNVCGVCVSVESRQCNIIIFITSAHARSVRRWFFFLIKKNTREFRDEPRFSSLTHLRFFVRFFFFSIRDCFNYYKKILFYRERERHPVARTHASVRLLLLLLCNFFLFQFFVRSHSEICNDI